MSRAFQLLKRGWHEIPEVIGSTFMAIIGVGCAVVGTMNYYAKDGDNRRYKESYIVYRHDDPAVKTIKE